MDVITYPYQELRESMLVKWATGIYFFVICNQIQREYSMQKCHL